MKITRKEIIKKGVSSSIIVAVPPIIKQVVDKCRYDINDQLFPILDKSLTPKPDLIVLNNTPVTCWDLYAFHYDVKNNEGPFMNTIEFKIIQPDSNSEILDSLNAYCKTNNIFIISESITGKIDLKDFCEYCKHLSVIKKFNWKKHNEYIKSVAVLYARCAAYQDDNKIKTDLSIHFGNVI